MDTKHVFHLFLFFVITFCSSCKTSKVYNDTAPAIIVNKGVAGNSTVDLLKRIDIDVVNENPDLVILMIGTNDMLNSKKMVSYDEYTSNLNKIVKTIKKNKSQVLMMSSPPVDSIYLFKRHYKTLFKESPNVKIDSVRSIVEEIAREHNTLYLNINKAFNARNVPKHNEDLYIRNEMNSNTTDGVHPTPLGYKFIAEQVYNYLEENNLTHKYKKIVCFGDSITKGSGGKGAGTVSGENYPSFLYTMLKN